MAEQIVRDFMKRWSLEVEFEEFGGLAVREAPGCLASAFVTGGHFLGNTMIVRRTRKMPWRAKTQRLFSALAPTAELARELNTFQSEMLGGFPSALEVLAQEQQAVRLHFHPVAINAAGETITDVARRQIAAPAQ